MVPLHSGQLAVFYLFVFANPFSIYIAPDSRHHWGEVVARDYPDELALLLELRQRPSVYKELIHPEPVDWLPFEESLFTADVALAADHVLRWSCLLTGIGIGGMLPRIVAAVASAMVRLALGRAFRLHNWPDANVVLNFWMMILLIFSGPGKSSGSRQRQTLSPAARCARKVIVCTILVPIFFSAVHKIKEAGTGWLNGRVFEYLRFFRGRSPIANQIARLAPPRFAATSVLTFETCCIVAICSRRLRPWVLIGAMALHMSIYLAMGINFLSHLTCYQLGFELTRRAHETDVLIEPPERAHVPRWTSRHALPAVCAVVWLCVVFGAGIANINRHLVFGGYALFAQPLFLEQRYEERICSRTGLVARARYCLSTPRLAPLCAGYRTMPLHLSYWEPDRVTEIKIWAKVNIQLCPHDLHLCVSLAAPLLGTPAKVRGTLNKDRPARQPIFFQADSSHPASVTLWSLEGESVPTLRKATEFKRCVRNKLPHIVATFRAKQFAVASQLIPVSRAAVRRAVAQTVAISPNATVATSPASDISRHLLRALEQLVDDDPGVASMRSHYLEQASLAVDACARQARAPSNLTVEVLKFTLNNLGIWLRVCHSDPVTAALARNGERKWRDAANRAIARTGQSILLGEAFQKTSPLSRASRDY